jgi:hypothetical protein
MWLVLSLSLLSATALAFELRTHGAITEHSVAQSRGLTLFLDDVGLDRKDVLDRESVTPQERLAEFRNDATPRGWMIEGAIREDDFRSHALAEALGCPQPLNPESSIDRPTHHFFDVQRSGNGLTLAGGSPAPSWALDDNAAGGANDFSVVDARMYQLRALTAPTTAERGRNAALMFRALGQVVHVLQDMAQPQHTRNDPHLGCANSVAQYFGGEQSWFEQYVEARVLGTPYGRRPTLGVTFGGYPAPSLPSYRDYWANVNDSGLAQFSGLNFFSPGTNLGSYSLLGGRCAGLPQPACDPAAYAREVTTHTVQTVGGEAVTGEIVFLRGAVRDALIGQTVPDVRLSTRSLWDAHLEALGKSPIFSLNVYNYDAMADLLIPRAVGYSAGFLDYFFRGRLDVDLEADPLDPSLVRITGTNASADRLDGGKLVLYADRPAAEATGDIVRTPATVVGANPPIVAEPGAAVESGVFQLPTDAERFMAIYTGALGSEVPGESTPGAVLGKALGGVRVEHVFADGNNWKIRTPVGVFTLPLTTSEFSEVQWGSGPDILVARTLFGEGQANLFASFRVARRLDSADFVTDPLSEMVTVEPLISAPFPFGALFGTTISFDQIVHYRQRIGVSNPIHVYRHWEESWKEYVEDAYEAATPEIRTVVERDFNFSDAFQVVLDTGHHLAFNPFGARGYRWDIAATTADTAGRILAIVKVVPSGPSRPLTQDIEFLGLNWMTGELEEQARAYVEPSMKFGTGPLWALMDVGSARIVASTAGPHVAFVSEMRAEAPPFAYPSYVWVRPTDPLGQPGIWMNPTFHDTGGPNPGVWQWRWSSQPYNVSWPEDYSISVSGDVRSDVGLGVTTAAGARRPELLTAVPLSTTATVSENTRTLVFFWIAHKRQADGIRITTVEGSLRPAPQLAEAHPWDVTETSTKLVLRAEDPDGRSYIVAWDHAAGQATVRAHLPPGSHGISAVTRSSALINSYIEPDFEPAAYVVGLDGTRPPLAFHASTWSFTLLEPSYLYNVEDEKFYRLSTPLRKTALPSSLAGTAAWGGSFHTLRLP